SRAGSQHRLDPPRRPFFRLSPSTTSGTRSRATRGKEGAMSIFGKILGKIFGSGRAEATTASSSSAPASSARPAAPVAGGSAGAAAAPARAPMSQVDVAAVLDDLAGKSKQKLDWRHSIVDLM